MKKLTTLLLAAGLVVSSFAGAQAGELKPILQLAEEFTYGDAGKDSPENFNATTRIRLGFDYVASEDLSATVLFQYRNGSWGHHDGDFTADVAMAGKKLSQGDQNRLRLAYIDWNIPGTDVKVRMGRHSVVAPSYAFGSAVLDGRGDGITVASAINDNINVGFSWFRIDSDAANNKATATVGYNDDADGVMLNAEFAYDGFKVAPWVLYAHTQKNAHSYTMIEGELGDPVGFDSDAFVIGASAELNMFDPFVFALDALYSNTKFHNVPSSDEDSFDGFYVALKGSYKFANGTASLGGWYASGDDDTNNDNGFLVLDGGFSASTVMFDGDMVGVDGYCNNIGSDSPFGTWGLIAEYADFSFIENLSHTARILYIQGTNENNDHNRGSFKTSYLTEDDSVVEIDFDTTYQIYKNLSATLQLGYAIFDQSKIADAAEQDDIFRSALTFVYKF